MQGRTGIRVKFKAETDANNRGKLKALFNFSPVYSSPIHGAKVSIEVAPK